jgi:hypothetical protein
MADTAQKSTIGLGIDRGGRLRGCIGRAPRARTIGAATRLGWEKAAPTIQRSTAHARHRLAPAAASHLAQLRRRRARYPGFHARESEAIAPQLLRSFAERGVSEQLLALLLLESVIDEANGQRFPNDPRCWFESAFLTTTGPGRYFSMNTPP